MVELPGKFDLPPELLETDRFVIWFEVKRGGKLAKIPSAPWKTGHWRAASATDPENWTDFYTALEYAGKKRGYGVGFCLSEEDDIIGIDLDDCINEEGEVEKWALSIINSANSYTEVSPSGEGVHIFLKGKLDAAIKPPDKQIEVYPDHRLLTVTGKWLKGKKVMRENQNLLDELKAKYGEKTEEINYKPKGSEVNIPILEVVPTEKLEKRGKQLQGPHPLHDSKTGMNFTVQPEENVWYCHHAGHDCGGGPFEWIALEEGIIECGEWGHGEGPLKGEKWIETVDAAERRGLISPEKARELTEKSVGALKEWQTVALNILNDNHFVTAEDSEDIYVYKNGVYRPRGEIVVKTEAQKRLGGGVTTHYVNEIINFVKRDTYLRGEKFNNPVHLINVKNGLLDPEAGELEEHSPEHVLTSQLPVRYDPEADCSRIKKFIKSTVPQQHVTVIQELFGYCLLKDCRFQKGFLWIGEGENGKSTLGNLLARFLGEENIASESLQKLVGDRFSPAELRDKLANIYSDLPQNSLKNTGMFKMLTGGDPIRAERKFGHPFKFWNFAKLVFSANRLPETYDDTHAFYRRLILIDFPYRFKKDPNPDNEMERKKDPKILEKITTEEELSGLLNWALTGLERLLENGEFSYSKSTSEIREHYLKMSDPVGSFAEERLKQDPDGWELKEGVYAEYRDYCRESDMPILDNNVFARKLKAKTNVRGGQKTVDGKRRPVWIGIELLQSTEHPLQPLHPLQERGENARDTGGAKGLNNFVEGREKWVSQEKLVREIHKVWDMVGGGTLTKEEFLDILHVKFENEPRKRLEKCVDELTQHKDAPLHFQPEIRELGGVS